MKHSPEMEILMNAPFDVAKFVAPTSEEASSKVAGPVGSLSTGDLVGALPRKPAIVCLCGSTRFHREFVAANYRETMAGKIVLSVGFYPHAANEIHGEGIGITPEQKEELDELHKRKIDLCDEILVLNVGSYIGSSTRSEVAYARDHGKPIRWLESSAPPARRH